VKTIGDAYLAVSAAWARQARRAGRGALCPRLIGELSALASDSGID